MYKLTKEIQKNHRIKEKIFHKNFPNLESAKSAAEMDYSGETFRWYASYGGGTSSQIFTMNDTDFIYHIDKIESMKLKDIHEKIEVQNSMSNLEQLCIKYINSMESQNSTAAEKYRNLITARLVGDNWNWNYIKYFINDLLNVHSEKDLYQLFDQYKMLDEV